MSHRIYNFCAGPCTLPLSVLEQVQAELLDFQGSGMSVMEISHRSKLFEPIHFEALALAKELIGAPDDFEALLLPAGAHQQFVMVAQNLLADGGKGAYVNSGVWGEKAYKEALRIGEAYEIWTGAENAFTTLPQTLEAQENTAYVHVTSNETIGGIQFREFPKVNADLVIDCSSDYYARFIPWERTAIVYGGVQKNLAPSGLALVFVRKDLLKDHKALPKFMTYKAHADTQSLYNTPPTFQIYILGLVLKWMKEKGGVKYFEEQSIEKSQFLYDFIDKSAFYNNSIRPEFRSRTNVIFRTPSDDLDTLFYKEAEKNGLSGLKGHRIVGGIRASIYNAMEKDGVQALLNFMKDFESKH